MLLVRQETCIEYHLLTYQDHNSYLQHHDEMVIAQEWDKAYDAVS
jgi:hypothetical protein